jgi:hypothetical protein
MPSSGLFITLYDNETLNLYLDKGVYGVLMPPVFGEVDRHSKHYAALADFACTREGAHVFFFLERRIVYGGQVIGSKDYGSYFFNGPYSPMGRNVGSKICWDESHRAIYKKTDKPGIFQVTTNGLEERCQPYLIRFVDKLGMKGKAIISDALYTELSLKHTYPLPSNSIQNMSFCTLTPGEIDLLLTLLSVNSEDFFRNPSDKINMEGKPIPFNPSLGISSLSETTSKLHFEASVLSDPNLLPSELRPEGATVCRKVPITPFKPSNMDRADICYYTDRSIKNGTIPNKVIELEWRGADEDRIEKKLSDMSNG